MTAIRSLSNFRSQSTVSSGSGSFSQNNSSPASSQRSPLFFQQSNKFKEEWFSLEGYLFMKCQSGGKVYSFLKICFVI